MAATDETVEPTAENLQNSATNEVKIAEAKVKKDNRSCCVKSKEEGEQNVAVPASVSPKHRRKIRQPKQYKPQAIEDNVPNGAHKNCEEPSEPFRTTHDNHVCREKVPGAGNTSGVNTALARGNITDPATTLVSESAFRAVDVSNIAGDRDAVNVPRIPSISTQESEVHVTTANQVQKQVESTSLGKRSKPKRAGQKVAAKKTRHQQPTVPKKPEELIREAIASGEPATLATKRDAQYRKSYAYKIWKERASCEVRAESGGSGAPGAKQGISIPVTSPKSKQNQGRTAYYWPPNQYNGINNVSFYVNGKYYGVNPQVLQNAQSGCQITQPKTSIPHVVQVVQDVTTTSPPNVRTMNSSEIVPSELQATTKNQTKMLSTNDCPSKKNIAKQGPPNVVVVSQPQPQVKVDVNTLDPPVSSSTGPTLSRSSYSPTSPQSLSANKHESQASASPNNINQNSPGEKLTSTECLTFETSESDAPCKDEKTKAASNSPSNLVSIMKSSLMKKHCKENVQPFGDSLKSKLKAKRKLETDKHSGSATKKSAKPTIFTPLNEQEAEKLANDIYDVNLEYFPFQTLAEKAARDKNNVAATPEKTEATSKVREIEKVRCLLKDFYDITHSCTEDPDMQKFDSASRKFGRKNILNHLSLLDRYFAELQKKIDYRA